MTKKKLLTVLFVGLCTMVNAQMLPYQNPQLSAEERAEDLLGRLTLEEKTKLMMDVSPAIPRLGIPEFHWWSEALHGIGRNGIATVFPITLRLDKRMISDATEVCRSGLQILISSVIHDGDADRRRMVRIPTSPLAWDLLW